MNGSMFLAGCILFGLIVAQLFRVHKADREYKELLREIIERQKELEKHKK